MINSEFIACLARHKWVFPIPIIQNHIRHTAFWLWGYTKHSSRSMHCTTAAIRSNSTTLRKQSECVIIHSDSDRSKYKVCILNLSVPVFQETFPSCFPQCTKLLCLSYNKYYTKKSLLQLCQVYLHQSCSTALYWVCWLRSHTVITELKVTQTFISLALSCHLSVGSIQIQILHLIVSYWSQYRCTNNTSIQSIIINYQITSLMLKSKLILHNSICKREDNSRSSQSPILFDKLFALSKWPHTHVINTLIPWKS